MKLNLNLSTQTLGFIAVMTALCVTSNYAMIGLPNIKFMDLFVFISGYCFGILPGTLVGVFTWLVYGTINPLGFSLPILAATSIGEALYGLVGGLSRDMGLRVPGFSMVGKKEHWICNFKIALIGFILTFLYDLFTNIMSGVTVGLSILVALISGIPFAILHEGSNLAFFFWGGAPLIMAVQRIPAATLRAPIRKTEKVERMLEKGKGEWAWVSVGLLCLVLGMSIITTYYYGEYMKYEDLYGKTLKDLEALTMQVNILINYGNGTQEWHNNTRVPIGFSLLNATLTVAKVDYYYYPYVKAINGVGGSKFWLWYYWSETASNWESGSVASNEYILHNGDIVSWVYTQF
jgi:hypothetical protein